MKILGLVLGGGLFAVILAAVAKSSASTTKPAGSSSSATTKPASSSSSSSSSGTPSGMTGQIGTPKYLSSTPYVIAMRVIELASTDRGLAQNQIIWLNDNGWTATANAAERFLNGEIDQAELRRVAATEWESKTKTTAAKPKVKGSLVVDTYGTYIIEHGTNDEIFSYASTATSIPSVAAAATKLAAEGDVRALELTQHLADLR